MKPKLATALFSATPVCDQHRRILPCISRSYTSLVKMSQIRTALRIQNEPVCCSLPSQLLPLSVFDASRRAIPPWLISLTKWHQCHACPKSRIMQCSSALFSSCHPFLQVAEKTLQLALCASKLVHFA